MIKCVILNKKVFFFFWQRQSLNVKTPVKRIINDKGFLTLEYTYVSLKQKKWEDYSACNHGHARMTKQFIPK